MLLINMVVLRVQCWSIIKPSLRRLMLNAIGAKIDKTAIIQHNCWITSPKIEMGPNSYLNAFTFIDATDWVVLEAGARVAVRATIITRTHGISDNRARRSDHSQDFVSPVRIGSGSWVGVCCTLLPGVTVARGCVIGAGATVTKDTEPDGLYLASVAAKRARDL